MGGIAGEVRTATHQDAMSLSDLLLEVSILQKEHSDINTTAMRRRGLIVRSKIPDVLSPHLPVLAQRALVDPGDLLIRGKDGAGRKAHVPWVRIASRERSPSPTLGWYVVYLWRRDGTGVYLVIAHGSTKYRDGSFYPRTTSELAAKVTWAKRALASSADQRLAHDFIVDLRSRTTLARAYERSCPAALFYPSTEIPKDAELLDDLANMMNLLGFIYEQERVGRAPFSEGPEVRDANEHLQAIASPLARRGQGPGLAAAERKTVELHAMNRAIAYLLAQGYSVEDRSTHEPYDLLASRQGEQFMVEVKGTTGGPDQVLLTANEVILHTANFGCNGLIIVHGVALHRGEIPSASGGFLIVQMPWKVDPAQLRALSYAYTMPKYVKKR